MGTHLTIESYRRDKLDDDGNEVFEVQTICTDEGDVDNATGLPDRGIFLFNIFNSRNAQADIFQRVCSINDLETYLYDRDAAIAANQEYWRDSDLTKTYDDLTTATQAATIISDRVNVLVGEYATYLDEFLADPEVSTYPTADPTYVESLKTTYTTKVTDFETSLETSDDAETARDTAQTTLTTARDSLTEWQETQDLVCGGNVSEEGNRYGLKTYVTEIANAFKNLYDGSGTSPYDTDAEAVKGVMDTFISSVESVQMGSAATVRLTVPLGTAPAATDIGKEVTATDGGSGYLISYDAVKHYWWIGDEDGGDWTGTAAVTGGTGSGAISAEVPSGDGPLDDLSTLVTSRDKLGTTLNAIIAAGLPTKMVDAIDKEIEGADAVCATVTATATGKATAVTTGESDLSTKETTYIEAEAAVQVAYDEVTAAYEAVKAVCPDWSPVPAVPAHP